MDDLAWKRLTTHFPRVPRGMRIEHTTRPTPAGAPIDAHARPILACAFSPDSRSVAVSGGGMIPGAVDVRVLDVASRELRTICGGHVMGVFDLAWDARTGLLASASHDYSVILWDVARSDAIFVVGGEDDYRSRSHVRFTGPELVIADGETFGDARGGLTVVDLERGEVRVVHEVADGHGIGALDVAGERIVIGDADPHGSSTTGALTCLDLAGAVRWRITPGVRIDDVASIGDRLVAIAHDAAYHAELLVFEPDGAIHTRRALTSDIVTTRLAVLGDRVAIACGARLEICVGPDLAVERAMDLGAAACSVAWSPDGAWIAIGTQKKQLRLFDALSGAEHLG